MDTRSEMSTEIVQKRKYVKKNPKEPKPKGYYQSKYYHEHRDEVLEKCKERYEKKKGMTSGPRGRPRKWIFDEPEKST